MTGKQNACQMDLTHVTWLVSMPRSSTTYQPKWKSGSTTVIRVPSNLTQEILCYARRLDEQASVVHDPPLSYRTAEDMVFPQPVNVASVPQRSPFRYPGGKTWLVPYIRSWLRSRNPRPSLLIEPFAGGGIVGLTAAFEKLADHVILVENDQDVAAVWQAILWGQADWLANKIDQFTLTSENVFSILDSEPSSLRERAFATILRNRVQRGGIMAPGAGLVKSGEKGRGIGSRWYPQTLASRIKEIAQIRDRFTFIEGDGLDVIHRFRDVEDAVFFVDPPYTVAAKRLYQHWQIDHQSLFAILKRVSGDLLLTYDNTTEIASLSRTVNFEVEPIAMKNTHHAKMTELLIGKDLRWLRAALCEQKSRARKGQEALAFPQ